MNWILLIVCIWLYLSGMLALYAIDPNSFGRPVILFALLLLLWPLVVPAVGLRLCTQRQGDGKHQGEA